MRADKYQFTGISRSDHEKQYYFDDCVERGHQWIKYKSLGNNALLMHCNYCGVLGNANVKLIKKEIKNFPTIICPIGGDKCQRFFTESDRNTHLAKEHNVYSDKDMPVPEGN